MQKELTYTAQGGSSLIISNWFEEKEKKKTVARLG
jgi:hypothetical protein